MNKNNVLKDCEKKKEKPKKEAIAKKIVQKKAKEHIKPENYFYLRDGRVLKDMIDLTECLETINNDIFCHHVNDSKNDFSNWIRDIFEKKDLAEEIMQIREPRQIQVIILKHLAKKR